MIEIEQLKKQRDELIQRMENHPTIDMQYLFMEMELKAINKRITKLEHGED